MATPRSLLALGIAGLLAISLGLSGCTTQAVQADSHGPGAHSANPRERTAAERAAEMDRMHEEGIKAFPAATEGKGNQPLPYELDGDVKVFRLEASKIKWEVTPGVKKDAMAYNGQVPGPLIRVTEGDKVRVIFTNHMDESTAVHWHGLIVDNQADGVPFITQPLVKPGETYTYEFTAVNPGTHMYHSHHNSVAQVTGGLLGALIVDPKDEAERTRYGETQDIVMVLNDGVLGYTINGKGFPATEPIVANRGEKIRIRFMNEGQIIHPMHLHGMPFRVVEKDGFPLDAPFLADTLNVAPGERYDVIIDAVNPGTWAFHCHILSHAESEHGMHGMVTLLVVK